MEQHIPLGMITAINVLPSKQPKIPDNVPTEGPCPVWSSDEAQAMAGNVDALEATQSENARLRQRVKDLESKLREETDAADRCLSRNA